MLVFLRSTKFWRGWKVPLCFILALVVAWIGLFAGQPSTNIQAYTPQKLEQPSASYELLLVNLVLLDENPIESVQHLHKINAVIRAGSYHSKDELDSIKKKYTNGT